MAEFKEISPNAPAGEKLMNWVDNRFPATKLVQEHMSQYYAPKNFNFWYIFVKVRKKQSLNIIA